MQLKYLDHLHPSSLGHLHDAEYVRYLGKGTFGDVKLYKCMECDNEKKLCNEYFVVKKIKCCKGKFNSIRKYLMNEYTIGTLLEHPNIRKTLDVDLIDNCLIFEYFQGIDFFEYLKNDDLKKDDELNFYKQFIDGVDYMHSVGVAHMDLKLENIMIDTCNKKIKIIDFGESKVFHDTNNIDTIITEHGIHGSEPYIAPEEFSEEFYDPEKVDVWSCGIILYEILYLRIPWSRACMKNNKYKLFSCNYADKESLLPLIFSKNIGKNLFIKMLNPDPVKRCKIKDIKKELIDLCVR